MLTEHIYWFAYFGTEEPSVRYRAKYALQQLSADHDISYDIVYPGFRPATIYRFLKVYCSILFLRKKNSVIVFEKIHTRRLYATALKILLRIRSGRTLYDIDDADYLKFPPGSILYFMRHVTQCAAGSRSLADFTARHNPNVFILTSPVIAHNCIRSERNKVFTIGWIGYYNAHRESLLQLFFPALSMISFPVKLVLMGVVKEAHFTELHDYFRSLPHVTIEIPEGIDWQNEHTVYQAISTFDAGIAPLLDTEINRAKSAFKLKQYMSCGVPVLASGTGENNVFLKDGINGYTCNSAAEFADRITLLANSSDDEYYKLSRQAQATVAEFSMAQYCHTLISNINK